jgi:hypothetical protein
LSHPLSQCMCDCQFSLKNACAEDLQQPWQMCSAFPMKRSDESEGQRDCAPLIFDQFNVCSVDDYIIVFIFRVWAVVSLAHILRFVSPCSPHGIACLDYSRTNQIERSNLRRGNSIMTKTTLPDVHTSRRASSTLH